jgi:hypothetical protein
MRLTGGGRLINASNQREFRAAADECPVVRPRKELLCIPEFGMAC